MSDKNKTQEMDSLGYFDTKQNIQVFLSSFSKKNFDATLGCGSFH
jgi:hypothetical protein